MFISFELLCLFNLALIPLALFLKGKPQRQSSLMIGAMAIPFIVMTLNKIVQPELDLGYELSVLFLHLGVSWINLILLWIICDRRWGAFLFGLLMSLVISLVALLSTPSLVFSDPYWGLIPGPISIDGGILLDWHWNRFWMSLLLWVLVLVLWQKVRKVAPWIRASAVTFTYWLIVGGLGFFLPTVLTVESRLEDFFREKINRGNFTVFIEDPEREPYPAHVWLEELEFLQKEVEQKLPSRLRVPFSANFKIFIYRDEFSKFRTVGARLAQVGNFLHNEMHLSELSPYAPTLFHELVHLNHGELKAPLSSYLDPFILEGFATGVSSLDPEGLKRKGAALLQEIESRDHKASWPVGMDFFGRYQAQVSYSLAGAFASQALESGRAPWEVRDLSIKPWLQIKLSEADLLEARDLLLTKSYFQDPLSRQCERLSSSFKKDPYFLKWQKWNSFCPRDKRLIDALYRMEGKTVQRKSALRLLVDGPLRNDELVGDLEMIAENPKSAIISYSRAKTPLGPYKHRLALSESGAKKLFDILSEKARPDLRVLELFPDEPDAQKIYLKMAPFFDWGRAFDALQSFGRLSTEEKFLHAHWLFYISKTRKNIILSPRAALQVARSTFKMDLDKENPEVRFFKKRLEWEISKAH